MPACRSRAADPALRCADVSLEERDLKAIAPFVKVVRELDRRQYWSSAARPARGAAGNRSRISALALTHSPGVALTGMFEDEKVAQKSS
jgi:hypothetical protein